MGNEIKRDLSIDFVKGIAALFVVLLHSMPNNYTFSVAWASEAVPLFLFISAWLTYGSFQNGKTMQIYYSVGSFCKMFKRIFRPFLLMTIVQFCIFNCIKIGGGSITAIIAGGGIGPGSYYPWLYFQAWIVLPLIIIIVDRLSWKKSMLLFIAICCALNILSSWIQVPDFIYRLAFYRYLFVLYLACMVRKYDVQLSGRVVFLGIISLFFLIFMTYTDINLEPFFFNQWRSCHWLGYFYTVLCFMILRIIYNATHESIGSKFFVLLGGFSYEVFLCQMFVFSFITLDTFSGIENMLLSQLVFIITTLILSIVPVLTYKLYIRRLWVR